ncbi:transporter substrate-binding domain-containing protein [Sneathiella sp. P13V-1]|uniref:transporter substrate-binding domain-containing protein n=1 Tax=Sneathiella sp. P13V-1 TaxID=2697366 RepID=UPI00187B7453|nr:transporter substrate-binding domain-containing protein [Sneathiella sp. P13V-1]MBE7637131.1 transporter substrate-binding domain-containing protein [Sneathiella sp. P13V-1]
MLKKIVSIWIILLVSFAAHADHVTIPKLYAPNIDGLVNANGIGSYVDMLRETLKREHVEINVLPYSRALKLMISSKEPACFFPGTFELAESLNLPTTDLIQSIPFNTVYGKIAYLEKNNAFGSLQDLKGKSIVVRQGFPIPLEVQDLGVKFIAVKKLEDVYQMLKLGRAPYAYIHQPDMNIFYMSSGKQKLYEHQLKLETAGERFLCNAGAKKFVNYLNTEIEKLYQNGRIFGILHYTYTGLP